MLPVYSPSFYYHWSANSTYDNYYCPQMLRQAEQTKMHTELTYQDVVLFLLLWFRRGSTLFLILSFRIRFMKDLAMTQMLVQSLTMLCHN